MTPTSLISVRTASIAEKGVVVHHVEADLADVYIGNDEERPFDLHGDTLILAPHWKVDGREWLGVRVFKRATRQS